jgi:TonB family protein
MSYLSIPTSSEPGLPERQTTSISKNEEPSPQSSTTDLLNVLREALADETKPAEAIFRAVADAARVLTGASGTALALRTGGVVVCRARSGDMAPALGSALSIESGISGECFRTSEVLHCNDAQADARVEPEVCRSLGIHSIVVVPLRGSAETIGILEAFSSEAGAFGDEQISLLESLGEIAEAAYARQFSVTNLIPVSVAASYEQISLAAFDEPPPKTKHHYWILSGAIAMLLLASAVVWWTWREPAGGNSSSPVTTQARTALPETPEPAVPKLLPSKPSASIANHAPDKSRTKVVLQNAAKVEPAEDVGAARSVSDVTTNVSPLASHRESTLRAVDSAAAPEDPPTVVLASTSNNNANLAVLASAPTSLPAMDLRVSQGVVEASIIRKVEPIYPREALAQRIAGTVTITASIAQDGTVGETRVLQGEPILAAAALAAVRQWRYRPCLLNGKPVTVQKEIKIIFKVP